MMVHLVVPAHGFGYERQGSGHDRPRAAFADMEDAMAFAKKKFPDGCDIVSLPLQPLSAGAQTAIDRPDLPASVARRDLAYLRTTTRPDAELQAAALAAGIEA